MFRKRSVRALAGGLIVILLLITASAAYAAVSGTFKGKTSQKQSISFHVGRGKLTKMRFSLLLKCPSGHIYVGHVQVFAAIKIHKTNGFLVKLTSSSSPTQDELLVSGRVSKTKVMGKLAEHRKVIKENAFCSGRTTFTANKQ